MEFLESYVEKCINNKKYFMEASLKAGLIIASIMLIIDIISGKEFKVALIGFVIMTIVFFLMWILTIKQLNKFFEKQNINIKEENRLKSATKKINSRKNIEKRNKRKK